MMRTITVRGVGYVRFADDFLILFQYENEARDVLEVLKRRLGKFMKNLSIGLFAVL